MRGSHHHDLLLRQPLIPALGDGGLVPPPLLTMTFHVLILCTHNSARSYRSKSSDEFRQDGAPPLSIVITVCDSAAAEPCPVFFGGKSGQPVKAHWGYPDPSNAEGGEEGKRRAFELTRQAIGYRMLLLLQLPLESMTQAELHEALAAISKA